MFSWPRRKQTRGFQDVGELPPEVAIREEDTTQAIRS